MKKQFTTKQAIVTVMAMAVATTTGVSAYAAAPKANEVGDKPNQAVQQENIVLSHVDDSSNAITFSTDNGETWGSSGDFQKSMVEWWTYDGYKAWIDEQKVELPKLIGQKYSIGGEMKEWTQETVDEVLRLYEDTLEQIKNGTKVSKVTDEGVLMVSPPDKEDDGAQMGSAYGVAFVDETGKSHDIGSYDTKAGLLKTLKPYCEELVQKGEMTQAEADALLAKCK